MRWLIELSGEHPTLPRAEALAAVEAVGGKPVDVSQDGGFLRFEARMKPELVAERLAFSHFVDEEIVAGSFDEVVAAAEATDMYGARFMVRAPAKGTDSMHQTIEKNIGQILARTGKVDLKRPLVTFRVLEGQQWHFCKVAGRIDRKQFERRKTSRRPFIKPVSLHPTLARALVNLSRIGAQQTLLDPFCGTGGILLEAALIGAEVMGSDVDERMAEGTWRTMFHYKRGMAGLFTLDVGKIPERIDKVDAIATDPPYGRSSSTKKEPLESLYRRSFEAFAKMLRPGGRVAICLPDGKYAQLAGESFTLQEEHSVKVHGSLTRHFMVFSRAP